MRPVRVVCGPYAALEDSLAAAVRASAPGPGGPPLVVAAPSRRLLDEVERGLCVRRGLALAGVHFLTFHGLAAALVDEAGPPARGELVLDPDFHDALLEELLDGAASGPPWPRGLAAAARASLRDLIDAGVDPAAARALLSEGLLAEPAERARLGGLLSLQAAYERRLGELGVLPPSALARLAAAAAPGSAWLKGARGVLYYGFYDLTGGQRELFEAVSEAAETTAFVPFRRGRPAFRFVEGFYGQALARGRVEHLAGGLEETALGPALDALFDPAAPPAPPAGSVELVSTAGRRDEAWAAAKRVRRWLAEGVPAEEIAVLARTLEPYRDSLAEAFAEEGIPLDLLAEEPLTRRPAAKAVLELLRLRRRDFPAEAVLELAGSPYFTAASPERAAAWRRAAARRGVRGGWLQWSGRLGPGSGEEEPGAAELLRLLSGLRARLEGPPASWSDRAAEAAALAREHLRLPADASGAEREAWEETFAALEGLCVRDRLGRPCSWDEFVEAFERRLSRAARSRRTGQRGVRALDAMDARGHRFRAVFLLGLQEGLFPRRVAEDPLLRDAARLALRSPGGWWLGPKAAGHEEERLLFWLCAASAKERLVLCHPRSDEEGRPLVPSTYLRELCRAAGLPPPGDPAHARVPRPPAERLACVPEGELTADEAALLAVLEGGSGAEALARCGGAPAWLPGAEAAADAMADRFAPAGAFDGFVRPPAPELSIWRRQGLSPSALDSLASCPFQFFARRLLGLPRGEEAASAGELDALARGTFYHRALELWQRRGGSLAALEAALEEVLSPAAGRSLGLYPLLWEAERVQMARALRGFAAWDEARRAREGLNVLWSERELSGQPAEGAPGGVPWQGRIDRVEADEEAKLYRVVDFKSRRRSNQPKLATEIAKGRSHQIPVYAELAGRALGEGWRFGGASLLFIEEGARGDKDRESALSPDELAVLRGGFLEGLKARLAEAAEGRFPIRPESARGGACGFCSYGAVCRKAHGPTRARAERLPGWAEEE